MIFVIIVIKNGGGGAYLKDGGEGKDVHPSHQSTCFPDTVRGQFPKEAFEDVCCTPQQEKTNSQVREKEDKGVTKRGNALFLYKIR